MEIRDLIRLLGGPSELAARLGDGVTGKAVSMWGSRGEIPGDYLLPVWRMASAAGLDWTPPGAEGLTLVEKERAA
jgi:hypothetical protein